MGQCNCPYWHGVFGGTYLPHIRRANFAHLIASEALADGAREASPAVAAADLDGDGATEIEIATPSMVLWVDPAEGGGVIAWDWRRARVNLVNVLTRRREAYHGQLVEARRDEGAPEDAVQTIHATRVRVKEPGLDRLLVYDRYRRAGFLDHILPREVTLDHFAAGEVAPGFAGLPYAAELPKLRSTARVSLNREASLGLDGVSTPVRIEKRFSAEAKAAILRVTYRVTNAGAGPLRALFGVETNWGITDPQSPVRVNGASRPARERTVVDAADRLELIDYGWPGPVVLNFPQAVVWRFPLETVSNSEAGFERTFQGLTCVCVWTLSLAPGEAREIGIECALESV
jgi:alpha-amylase